MANLIRVEHGRPDQEGAPGPIDDRHPSSPEKLRVPVRGSGDPPLVVADGASGVIMAVESRLARSPRRRCLAHGM